MRAGVGRALYAVVAALALLANLALAPQAQAAGSPNITFSLDSQASTLLGGQNQVTLSSHNPTGQPYGYNLSYQTTLPAGVSYVAGSSSNSIEPEQFAAGGGATSLVWSNVSDLSPNSSNSFSFRVSLSAGVWPVGSNPSLSGGAYINSDPRYVPDFDSSGQPVSGASSYTGFATGSDSTVVSAIQLTKSGGGSKLRGVHNQKFTYSLQLRNNPQTETANARVEDWIPAGVEYLGCANTDNTTDAPTNPGSAQEYPGSGPLTAGGAPALSNCVAPSVVETISTDPDGAGPAPSGIYTHLVWSSAQLGDLDPGEVINLDYAVGIPIRANTLTWTGPIPGTGGAQGSNLNNNSGAETFDEQALRSVASATGDFDPEGLNSPVSSESSVTTTAEDLLSSKTRSTGTITQGGLTTWTLTASSSEYRVARDIRLADTLPNGLCPLGSQNFEHQPPAPSAECDPQAGQEPSSPYTEVSENADGTWQILFDQSTAPSLAELGPNQSVSVTFPTRTRTHYQSNYEPSTPILSADSWANSVSVSAADYVICAPSDPFCEGSGAKISHDEPDGIDDTDSASASQTAAAPTLSKQIGVAPGGGDCAEAAYVSADTEGYGPGDRVCYKLRLSFPGSVDTGSVRVTDFLPRGSTYVPGSVQATPQNTVPVQSSDFTQPGVLQWQLGSGGYAPTGTVFEYTLAATLPSQTTQEPGDITANLLKASYANTASTGFSLRAQRDAVWEAPVLDLTKDVVSRNGSAASDGVAIAGGDQIGYLVQLQNSGDRAVSGSTIWDNLPAAFSCAQVVVISDGGSCSGGRITWTGISVGAGSAQDPTERDLTYTIEAPLTLEPGSVLTNEAGVRDYSATTNTGGSALFYPEDNIDPSVIAASQNAPAADDTAFVTTPDVTLAKSRSTSITEGGNNSSSQATIGERINYTVTLSLPGGTTIYGFPTLTDPLGSRQTLVAGSVQATRNGGALPPAVSANSSSNTVTLAFPSNYTVDPAGETYVLSFSAVVDNDYPDNQRLDPAGGITNNVIANRADFNYQNAAGTALNKNSSVNTSIVEPLISSTKTVSPTGTVTPGQILTYTVRTSNSNATGVSQANDVQMTDTIPAGLTPIGPAPTNTPIPDGGSTPDGGVWNASARTITWDSANLSSIGPNANRLRTYRVQVDSPVVGSLQRQNTVVSTAASLSNTPTAHPERRSADNPVGAPGYKSQAQVTVTTASPAATKTANPTSGTPGDKITYTVNVTIPGGLTLYNDTIIDTLPNGLVFDSYGTAQCTSGCASAGAITPETLQPVPVSGGTTRIGWTLGNLSSASGASSRTVQLTYNAHIARNYFNGSNVVAGQSLSNSVRNYYNRTDKGSPAPGSPTPLTTAYDASGNAGVAAVGVTEPNLGVSKTVVGNSGPANATRPGDSYTYSVRVTNNGAAPAYDVVVEDLPPASLTNVVASAPAGASVSKQWSSGDRNIGWTIPGPIQPGAGNSVVLTYTADLAASAELSQNQTVPNTAHVPSYWGVPQATRTADGFSYREYINDPSSSQSLSVRTPQLQMQKTTGAAGNPDTAAATIDAPFSWRVVVSNAAGGSVASNVDVEDALPPYWTYVPGSSRLDGSSVADPTESGTAEATELRWNNLGSVQPGASRVLTFEAIPTTQAAEHTGIGPGNPHINEASVSAEDASGATASADGAYAAGPDTAEATIQPSADLAAEKELSEGELREGEEVTYRLTTENLGPSVALGSQGSDTLPASLQPVEATVVSGAGSCVVSGQDVSCSYGSIAAGAQRVVEVRAIVQPNPPATVENTYSVSTNSDDPNPANDSDTATDPSIEPDLAIDKRVSGAGASDERPTQPGDHYTYSLAVTNDGTGTAYDVEVRDLPDPAIGEVEVAEGAGWTVTKAWSEADRRIEWSIPQIAPGQTITLTYTAALGASIDRTEGETVTNTAGVPSYWAVSSATRILDPSFEWTEYTENPEDSVTLIVQLPELELEKTTGVGGAESAAAEVDQPFPWRITLSNDSTEADFSSLDVTDTLPAGWSYVEGSATFDFAPAADPQITESPSGDQLEWAELGALGAGEMKRLTFQAVPTIQAVESGGFGPENPHTNEAAAAALDGSGSPLSGDGPYVAGPDEAEAILEQPEADLAVQKDLSSNEPLREGAEATYSIGVVNNGPSYALDAELSDQIPSYLEPISVDHPDCAISPGAELTCDFGTLAQSAERELVLRVIVLADPPGMISNTAEVTTSSDDPAPANNTSTSAEPSARPEIAIDKRVSGAGAADQRDTQPGDSYQYEVEVTNNGSAPAYDVVVQDEPPAELVGVVADEGASYEIAKEWDPTDREIRWMVPELGVGEQITLTYQAELGSSSELTNNQTLTNTAHAPSYWAAPESERSASPGFGWTEFTEDPQDSVELTVHTPQLHISKTTGAAGYPDSAPAYIEQAFPWRITVTNASVYADAEAAQITDTLPANWRYVPGSAELSGGRGQVDPTVSSNPAGDVLVWEVGALAAGESVVVDFQAEPHSQAAINPGPGANTNEAEVAGEDDSGASGDASGPYIAGPDSAIANLIVPVSDLAITKTTSALPVAGAQVAWELGAENLGPETAPSVRVRDFAPAGTTVTAVESDRGECSIEGAGAQVVCELGEMKVGPAHKATISVEASVDDPGSAGQMITNVAMIFDEAVIDPDPANDTASVTDAIEGSADISVQKTALDELVYDQNARYSLRVLNDGPSVARSVTLTDPLPAGLSAASVDDPDCEIVSAELSCELGDFSVGEAREITLTARVTQTDGEITNEAAVDSLTADPDPDNNVSQVTSPVGAPDLSAQKTLLGDGLTRGKMATYSIDVSNTGSAATHSPVVVSDPMPEGLESVSAQGPGWNCSLTTPASMSCSRSDSLGMGESYPQITLRVRVDESAPREITNVATVSGGGDPTPSTHSNPVRSTVGDATASCQRGGRLQISHTVIYAGTQPKIRVRVTDRQGRAVGGAKVRVKVGSREVRRRTGGAGLVRVKIRGAGVGKKIRVSVAGCPKLKRALEVRAVESCSAYRVRGGYGSMRSMVAAQRTRLRVRVVAPNGLPLVGSKVQLRGAGVRAEARTNRAGRVKLSVRPKRAGILTLSAKGVQCELPIGVTAPADDGGQLTG